MWTGLEVGVVTQCLPREEHSEIKQAFEKQGFRNTKRRLPFLNLNLILSGLRACPTVRERIFLQLLNRDRAPAIISVQVTLR